MQTLMLSRREKLLSRLPAKPSFAGTGLLERMRSTTFALLGITAAMGLGLVAVASQQSWPLLPAAPVPGLPWSGEVEEATVVVAAPIAPISSDRPAAGLISASETDRGDRRSSGSGANSQLSDSRTLATAPPQPAPDPASEPPSASPPPVAAAPSPAPPAESPSVPEPSSSQASSPATPALPPPALSGAKEQDSSKGKEYVKEKSPGGGKGSKPTKSATGSPASKPVKGDKPDAAATTTPAAPVVSPVVKPDETGYDEKEEASGYSPGYGKDRGQAQEHGK